MQPVREIFKVMGNVVCIVKSLVPAPILDVDWMLCESCDIGSIDECPSGLAKHAFVLCLECSLDELLILSLPSK